MITPDLLVVWPDHLDFPWFRRSLIRFRPFFNKIYICLADGHILPSCGAFLRKNIDADFLRPRLSGPDWRDNCVKELLEASAASHVLFMEQDFLIRDAGLIINVLSCKHDFVFHAEGERIHPAFALVKKDLIRKTQQNFSAMPPKYDHFGLFFDEVLKNCINFSSLNGLGLRSGENFYHLAGTTQNYYNFLHGEQFYKGGEFLAYNALNMNVDIVQDSEFLKLSAAIANKFGVGDIRGFLSNFYV
jgi:hypothetical protein